MTCEKGTFMKGVVLAGGLGTRLRPLTSCMNKHLLPVHDRPMIFYPLQTLAEAGILDVMVVVGGQSTEEILKLLKDGREFGLKRLYYVYQEGEGGIAAALDLTEEFVDGEQMCVILGDNILADSIYPAVEDFQRSGKGAGLLITTVEDPQNYGCVVSSQGKPRIVEKPNSASIDKATQIVTGVYLYDSTVFDKIRRCKPSGRGELEITDVNNMYLEEGNWICYCIQGFWGDAGSSIEGCMKVSSKVAEAQKQQMQKPYIVSNSLVQKVQR